MPTMRELETLAAEAHRDGRDYSWFHRRHWDAIYRAAHGRRKMDMGTLVDRLIAIIETGQIPR